MGSNEVMSPRGGEVVRREFGAVEQSRSPETAVTAAAAQARAAVEAMYVMALKQPRDLMAVRDRLLTECRRKGFAESATYRLPRGGKTIEGPSIRFAEAAARALHNIHVRTSITYEDDERRVGEVTVIDLEANLPLSAGFTLDKTVERRNIKAGDVVVSERVNSTGQTVFRIVANEADILMKQESLVARLRRNLILQLLPGDLRDEAMEACAQTMAAGDGADPKATAKKIADYFGALGVSVAALRDYLGHALDQVTPDEAKDLRGVYSAIKDGQTSWAEVMEAKRNGGETTAPMTPDEKAEKAKLIKDLAIARTQGNAAYDAAMKAAGVASGVPALNLPIETLRKVAAILAAAQQHATAPTSQAVSPEAQEYFRAGNPAPAGDATREALDGLLDGRKE